ncbi:MAG: glycosyltransferase [Okeania sp. SIO3I5]|uniref:glycosyltransferase family 4 protein n=1 Tax=Okeania sp. SIO3I5 TaxID=2607805 RepID=UPI0013BA3D79|nr:glycosyltransferase [Okeania sp. SIO3I5]NEQ40752.1 glycosyltransferase [Okeania sp. SIO3I5]
MLNRQIIYDFGINVAGHINGDFGLAEGVRSTLKALETTDIPVVMNDLPIITSPRSNTTYRDFSIDNPYPINLVHTNPNWVYQGYYGRVFPYFGIEYFPNKYNIGFWFWELPKFPEEWEFAFNIFDEVWAASKYTAESIAAVSPVPVIKIPLTVDLPQPKLTRKDLNWPENKFIFLFVFDFGSSFHRKNAMGSIKAFQNAFEKSQEDVLLIIKFTGDEHFPDQRKELDNLLEGWSSIMIVDRHLPREEVLAFLKNCDCYISLHRAEGFGLTMAEAMFYGKPVIATGYSSNMDFMNVGNSFLVRYELVTTTEDYGFYPKGSVWADPDVDHAAYFMKYVFENYQEAQKVGAIAAEDVRYLLSPETIGKKIKSRLEHLKKMGVQQMKKEWLTSQAESWKLATKKIQLEFKSTNF